MNRASLLQLLSDHHPWNAEEAAHAAQTMEFVRDTDDFASRINPAGHLTGSAWVVNPAGDAVLLIHHVNLDRWLQPGGHVEEGDATIQATAQREAREECGIEEAELVDLRLYDIDVHPIPERKGFPAHLHYDFRFLVRVPDAAALLAQAEEIHAVKWFRPEAILALQLGPSVDRMTLKLVSWLKS
jgi:8-oxo-dGTP pyrophosphatase MutT (NUDIX family)